MAGRVTIQDIADALGISRNTVSKAINNTGILADATREKILQKAVEMGYKQFSYVTLNGGSGGMQLQLPGSESQGTMSETGQPVGTSGPRVSGQFLQGLRPAAEKNVIALFTTIFLGNSHFSSTMLDKFQREISFLGYTLVMHRVDAADLAAMRPPLTFRPDITAGILCFEMFHEAYDRMLCELNTPVLFVDAPVIMGRENLRADRLIMENRSNICKFVAEMARRGKKRIGYIGEAMHCTSFFERYMGYREALLLLGLPFEEDCCISASISELGQINESYSEQYRDYIRKRIGQIRKLPDVFICANDFVAIDTLQVFRELGISVPEDVYLCGFDDSQESRIITPRLTTIHIHSQIMGYSAVQLLLSRIQEPSLNYRTMYTETTLIYRESTGD